MVVLLHAGPIDKLLRIFIEHSHATESTEVVYRAPILTLSGRCCLVDLHSTNGVLRHGSLLL
ncbi:MAG: hypothetical protein A3G43_03040 [Ignavibacteria bacterium RIFCSPLOWO2_12_FULL_56_21]|nr:MAG: hypothetical protein A3G43_03040 [Ignavibacteria bacterium RIFCSPLOWO2_12_FULL_56_21]